MKIKDTFIKFLTIRKCWICEKEFKMDELKYTEDPFLYEIYGDKTKHWMCDECYGNSCDEI